MDQLDQYNRALKYAELSTTGMKLMQPLGSGTDGAVWRSSNDTAIKSFERMVGYFNERDSYLRLAEYGFTRRIEGFWIPQLIEYNDDFWIVEMEIVSKAPYVIDFGKVRIDRPPDFSEEVLEQHEAKCRELFEHHWPEVKALMATLESIGISYLDPQLGNIVFADLTG
jgi:hypothetical protein